MGIVLVYDVEVFEGENEDKLVLAVRSVRGAAQIHELVAEYYRRRRSVGRTPSHVARVTCHRVNGESLYKQGIAVLVPEEGEDA